MSNPPPNSVYEARIQQRLDDPEFDRELDLGIFMVQQEKEKEQ